MVITWSDLQSFLDLVWGLDISGAVSASDISAAGRRQGYTYTAADVREMLQFLNCRPVSGGNGRTAARWKRAALAQVCRSAKTDRLLADMPDSPETRQAEAERAERAAAARAEQQRVAAEKAAEAAAERKREYDEWQAEALAKDRAKQAANRADVAPHNPPQPDPAAECAAGRHKWRQRRHPETREVVAEACGVCRIVRKPPGAGR